jgi:UDP-3-O-[3-hydroxymyristoyl] glucosamine N-acyltransferase
MPDARFFETAPAIALDAAVSLTGATLARGAGGSILRAAGADEPDLAGAVIFLDNKTHVEAFDGRIAGLILTTLALAPAIKGGSPVATLAVPRLGFAKLADALHRERGFCDQTGTKAKIHPSATIHPSAVIAAGAVVGPGAEIGPCAAIGPGVEIGARTRVGAGATIVCALIGADAVVKAGARIGQSGFGFVPSPEGLVKMPQLGRAIIGDGVEIGANACVDRGALGDTVIEAGAKIDNLVQIAHNVRVGASSVLAAQVGVSGSTRIGKGAMLGGKAGLADHLAIGDGAQIAAAAGVMHDIPAGERWGGSPARPMRQWFRETATLAKLAMRGKSKDGD